MSTSKKLATEAADLARRVIREWEADDGMTVGLKEDAEALLALVEDQMRKEYSDLSDRIRAALVEASETWGQRTGIPAYRYLGCVRAEEINAVLSRVLWGGGK